ncbi:MAG: inositol monophosphatase family protein [Leptolyngbya sp. SIO1D8]|nr:inositol monophosphatase family protein [Leptolyngbya sp. SIO1D8]
MIDILVQVVSEVAQYQRRAFTDADIVFQTKTNQFDLVSEVDKRSQQMLLAAIERYFPASGIVAEEDGQDKPSRNGTWFLVDPLDGTANFKAGIPLWAISIGFVRDGVVNSGIISLPSTGEIFCSQDSLPIIQPLEKLAAAQFYGIDSTFENSPLTGLMLRRRQLGAAVPTLLWCCESRNRQRPRLDFALMGKGSFWDVCGAIAFLKQKGGALIDVTGQDFTECTDVFQALGGVKGIRTYNFRYVASASKKVAQEVYQHYLRG